MKQHRYRITVEHLADTADRPSTYSKPLQFEIGNHDDIFQIVARARQMGVFDETTATAFAVGLKLFSEVMLEQRGNPLFAEIAPQMGAFMQRLKRGSASAGSAGPAPGRAPAAATFPPR